ncbi:MAG TPA: nucleotide exchange factor GrpE [Ilumatobacteraceae bacterium]|nr:nucleotide exchange factor GrpE [Ilumatobacteraceae bacterium]
MVDPPEPRDPSAAAPDGGLERGAEIGDIADSMQPLEGDEGDDTDEFDLIVGEIDFSDVDVPVLLAEREEYKGMAQRIQADFDNYRKRSAAQSLAEADRASGRLAEALLPVLDAAEAAFVRHPDEVGPLLNQMLVELKKHGLEALDLEGQPFDPEFAEAVAHEPGDGGEPIVSEVLRSGYTWKGKMLRAAMVKTRD